MANVVSLLFFIKKKRKLVTYEMTSGLGSHAVLCFNKFYFIAFKFQHKNYNTREMRWFYLFQFLLSVEFLIHIYFVIDLSRSIRCSSYYFLHFFRSVL